MVRDDVFMLDKLLKVKGDSLMDFHGSLEAHIRYASSFHAFISILRYTAKH